MNIYKYGLTQDKVIYVLECEVLQEKDSPRDGRLKYEIREGKTKKWIYADELEIMSNKVLYSASGDEKQRFIESLKDSFKLTIEGYLKKAEGTKALLEEILKINNC